MFGAMFASDVYKGWAFHRLSEQRLSITLLRAFSVLGVVLFHAEVPGFSWGYLGVDIFFVISGYLMAMTIRAGERQGFAFYQEFLLRRFLRVYPAALVMIVVISPLFLVVSTKDGLENFAQSVVASALMGNNVLLFLTTGYWDQAADFKPLLHTWSLGVEAQFYVALALVGCMGLLRGRLGWLIVVLAVSASLDAFSDASGEAKFYLFPFRVWELLFGFVLFLRMRDRCLVSGDIARRLGFSLAALGLVAVLVFGSQAGAAVQARVSACLFALVVILFGSAADDELQLFLKRSIALQLFGWVGLSSYSLYLWHQPVFVAARVLFDSAGWELLLLLAPVSLLLGVISFLFIEEPVALARGRARVAVFFSCVCCSAVLVSFGLLGFVNPCFVSPNLFGCAAGAGKELNSSVHRRVLTSGYQDGRGLGGAADGSGYVLVVGDSFARDFVNVLDAYGFVRYPVFYKSTSARELCAEDLSSAEVASAVRVFIAVKDASRVCGDIWSDLYGVDASQFVFLKSKGFGFSLGRVSLVAKNERAGLLFDEPDYSLGFNHVLEGSGVTFFDPFQTLRRDDSIRVADDGGRALSFDGVHLSEAGAAFVARESRREFARAFPELVRLP